MTDEMTEVPCPICGMEIVVEDVSPDLNDRVVHWARSGHYESGYTFIARCGCHDGKPTAVKVGLGRMGDENLADMIKQEYAELNERFWKYSQEEKHD